MKWFIRNKKSKNVILNLFVAFGVATAQNLPNGFRIKSGMTSCVAMLFCLVPSCVFAADLLADEQGATAPEAVTTLTAGNDFLTPTYTIPAQDTAQAIPSEVDILNEIFGSDTPAETAPKVVMNQTNSPLQHTFSPRTGIQCADETPLLTPLPPLPVIQTETPLSPKKTYFKQSALADQALATATSPSAGGAMPREVRITYYPDQSALTAQALKWVKALAMRVLNNPTLLAEIHISDKNQQLQEKRLSIIVQVLKEVGLSRHQIRLYQTKRDKDSVLIGYVNNPDYTMMQNNKKSTERVQKTIKW